MSLVGVAVELLDGVFVITFLLTGDLQIPASGVNEQLPVALQSVILVTPLTPSKSPTLEVKVDLTAQVEVLVVPKTLVHEVDSPAKHFFISSLVFKVASKPLMNLPVKERPVSSSDEPNMYLPGAKAPS